MKTKKITIALISALIFAAHTALAAAPENVTGLTATAIDESSIGLTWSPAKDSDGGLVKNYRVYYGTTSVFEARGGDYDSQVDTPSNNTSYVVAGLAPSTTYYFSITAINSANEESGEYSLEASATTLAAEGEDTTSPTVTSVSAPDTIHVKVVFSEAVQLPVANPETAFSIVEQINPANTLAVTKAEMDSADASNKTVVLETGRQTTNVNYIITVGVAIKDLAGNPMVSGSTDSGLFLGSANEPAEEAEETPAEEEPAAETEPEEPLATTAPATDTVDCEMDMVTCFLGHLNDCSGAKVKQSDDTYEYTLEITGIDEADCVVKYTADKHPNVLFSSTDMECKITKGSYALLDDYNEVFNLDEKCSGDLQAGYRAVTIKDTTPPENITNLLLKFKQELEKFTVMLSWTASLNTAKDLVDQILYMSMDRGTTYDAGKSLGAEVISADVADLEGGKEYTFKVTTKDATGNESTGAVKSIRLPQTGMGLGLAMMGSLYVAHRVLRRKKEDGEL